jgi:hypothetical protein
MAPPGCGTPYLPAGFSPWDSPAAHGLRQWPVFVYSWIGIALNRANPRLSTNKARRLTAKLWWRRESRQSYRAIYASPMLACVDELALIVAYMLWLHQKACWATICVKA